MTPAIGTRFCDGPYAYHRLYDSLVGRFNGGDSIKSVAEEWGCEPDMMVAKWLAFRRLEAQSKRGRRKTRALVPRVQPAKEGA